MKRYGESVLDDEDHVYHPINAFHLLKRTCMASQGILKSVAKHIGDEAAKAASDILLAPDMNDFKLGATLGIINVQHHHDLDIKDVLKGQLFDPVTGKVYRSAQNLSSSDAMQIMRSASQILLYNSAVEWAKAMVFAAKVEAKPQRNIKLLTASIKEQKKVHDEVIYAFGWMRFSRDSNGDFNLATVNQQPFKDSLMEKEQVQYFLDERESIKKKFVLFKNLNLYNDPDDVPLILTYCTKPVIRKLCQGQNLRPASLDASLKCLLLHRQDPYFKLGPLKYEPVNEEPHFGVFRDFASAKETERMKSDARGQMKSTPLNVQGKTQDFSKQRTSKVNQVNFCTHACGLKFLNILLSKNFVKSKFTINRIDRHQKILLLD